MAMDELSAFERRLARGLETIAGPRREVDAAAVAQAAASHTPVLPSSLRGMERAVRIPRVPWRLIGAVALLVISVAAGSVIVGGQRRPLPAVVGLAGNGLVAYSSGGDIFVGDPIGGDTLAIVVGPEQDSLPTFSPDGTHIAFVRGDPMGEDPRIVVVRVDGTDERFVTPAGFTFRGLDFAWTPDSASLVVNHDSRPASTPYFDGELSLVDASGIAEPRVLTPPLPRWPGTSYFDPNAQVAPMFRPPDGDLILSGNYDALEVFDAELGVKAKLGGEQLEEFEPYWVGWPAWSPDGSRILFGLDRASGNATVGQYGTHVLDADGTDLRLLGSDLGTAAWSPDGSLIAAQRGTGDAARPGAVIVIVDVASGTERVLGSTTVDRKIEGEVPNDPNFAGYTSPTGRMWDFEGWSWAPDGQSIVVLERYGTRPIVVNVETGEATELPWEADSAPSWQRVPVE
jgi:dipeptidyl aminopeptidase/acylaminoacyl peptidase